MKRLWSIPLSLLLALPTWAQRAYHGDGPDDVLRFVPVATVYALKTCGVESKSGWKNNWLSTPLSPTPFLLAPRGHSNTVSMSGDPTGPTITPFPAAIPHWPSPVLSSSTRNTVTSPPGSAWQVMPWQREWLSTAWHATQRSRLCRGNGSGCRPHSTQPPCLAGCHSRSHHRCGQYALGLLARRENHGRAQPLRSDHRRTKPQPLHTTLQQIIPLPSHTLTVFNFCADKLNHLTTR